MPPSLNIALLTKLSPSSLGNELTRAGYTVWEAISASEVLHLCEYHDIAVVVVEAGVADARLGEVQARCTTMWLKVDTTASDAVWELGLLFPSETLVQ